MEFIGAIVGLSFGWLVFVFWMLALVVSIGSTVLWVYFLIEVLRFETDENNTKLLWALVIIFTGWLGAVIYLFVRRPGRLKTLRR
ncbi:MAG: PLDc N-terminal domain-containing protein [bacterium]